MRAFFAFFACVLSALALGCMGEAGTTGMNPGSTSGICPTTMQAHFSSIRQELFAKSCGTGGASCHSAAGSVDSGGLDLATDPYGALVGKNAANLSGSVNGLVRVKPGDPDGSFLVIKLRTMTSADPQYGSGMPFTSPGSVCSGAVNEIVQWIAQGAPND
jgi:hypothetical protein